MYVPIAYKLFINHITFLFCSVQAFLRMLCNSFILNIEFVNKVHELHVGIGLIQNRRDVWWGGGGGEGEKKE